MPATPPPLGAILRTATRRLSLHDLADENILAIVRSQLLAELDDWARCCGYDRHQTRELVGIRTMTLTAQMTPRTDGEWPSVHQAIREDADERRRLKTRHPTR